MVWLKKIFAALTRIEHFVLYVAGAIAALSASVLFINSVVVATETIPASGGEHIEAIIGQPSEINPALALSAADKVLLRLIFSNLEDISDKIEISKNGRVWTVRIKEDLFWSDGARLTSDDIVFTVQKIQAPETYSPLFSNWQGVRVKRVSQLEVAFELASPYIFFLDNIHGLYIMPKHLFADVPSANWRFSEYMLRPVGSGPYKINSLLKNKDGFIHTYRLTPNQYSWKKPKVEVFTLKFFPNAEAAVKSFNLGRIYGLADLDSGSLAHIKRPYVLAKFTLPSYYAVFFNQSDNPALQDSAVRRALAFSAPREKIVEEIFKGHAEPAYGPLPPGIFDIKQESASSSSENISGILEAAGWKLRGDNIREKLINKTAVPLEFDLLVPEIPFLTQTAPLLEEAWSSIGAKVNIVNVDPDNALGDIIKNRDYSALLLGNALNAGGDLFSFWHSSQRFHPGLNLSFYNSRRTDQFIESARQTADEAERKKLILEAYKEIKGDFAAVFLFSPEYLYAVNRDLKGVRTGVIYEPADRFLGVENWYVKTARVFK